VVSKPVLSLSKQTMNGASLPLTLRQAQGERQIFSDHAFELISIGAPSAGDRPAVD
jgi:hypothetical protein